MYTVLFYKNGNSQPAEIINVPAGQTLLEVALNNGIALQHDCGGACTCTTCHLFIEEGLLLLEPPSKREIDFLKKVNHRKLNSRLSCQCILREGSGQIKVTIPQAGV